MINWTSDKPTVQGRYLFLHFRESEDVKVMEVISGPHGDLLAWNDYWLWYEPLWEVSNKAMWSHSPVNLPEEKPDAGI